MHLRVVIYQDSDPLVYDSLALQVAGYQHFGGARNLEHHNLNIHRLKDLKSHKR
jgi:hypothetical protein